MIKIPVPDNPASGEPQKKKTAAANHLLSGKISQIFPDIQMGTITAEDGLSYSFDRSLWLARFGEPEVGMSVLVEIERNRVVKFHATGWRNLTGPQ